MTFLALKDHQEHCDWPWIEFRRVASARRQTNFRSDKPLLALSAASGIQQRPDGGGRQPASDETISKYWVVHPGDLVFNPMWAIEGGVAVSQTEGAVSTAYRIYNLHPSLHPPFAHHYFRCEPALQQYRLMIRGVTTFDRSITRSDFEAMPVPIPPLSQQQTIAAFLDSETAKVDALVAKKRQLIERLIEYRIALITRTVTKGLPPDVARAEGFDPSTPLKPSGAEWIGEVPKHWSVGSLNRTFDIVNGGTPASNDERYWDGNIVWLTPDDLGQVHDMKIGRSRRNITQDGVRNSSAQVSPKGSIVLSTRAPIGHLAVTTAPTATNQGCRTLVPQKGIHSGFVYYSLLASRSFLESLGKGSTFMELSSTDLGSHPIPLPPQSEQQTIAAFLHKQAERIDALLSRVEVAIERLHEYQTALIAAAVTGKIDVRGFDQVETGVSA